MVIVNSLTTSCCVLVSLTMERHFTLNNISKNYFLNFSFSKRYIKKFMAFLIECRIPLMRLVNVQTLFSPLINNMNVRKLTMCINTDIKQSMNAINIFFLSDFFKILTLCDWVERNRCRALKRFMLCTSEILNRISMRTVMPSRTKLLKYV